MGWSADINTTLAYILLSGNGGTVTLIVDEDGEVVTYPVYFYTTFSQAQISGWEVEGI